MPKYNDYEDEDFNYEEDYFDEPKKRDSSKFKIYFLIISIVLIYLFYNRFILGVFFLLINNPTIYTYYLFIESQISNTTLLGILILSILGAIFFLSLPSEIIFIYFLNSHLHNSIIILLVVVFGNTIGLVFNYLFGRMIGEALVKKLFAKSFNKYNNWIDKFGGFILYFGNIIPGPIELLTIFFGSFKYGIKRYAILCFFGRLTKFVILLILFTFYWDQVMFQYNHFIENFLSINIF